MGGDLLLGDDRLGLTPGFKETLAFEWTKFASLRSTRWTLFTTGALTMAGAVFVGLSDSLQPDDTVLGGSLTLSVVSLMIAGVVGALTICGEFGSGTIASTFSAVPRRGRVLAAKAALLVGLLYATGLAACAVAYLLGGAVLEDGTYAQGEPLPALFGIAGLFALVGFLGLAVRRFPEAFGRSDRHSRRRPAAAVPVRAVLRRSPALDRRGDPDRCTGKTDADLGCDPEVSRVSL